MYGYCTLCTNVYYRVIFPYTLVDNSRNQPQTNSVQPQSETTSQQAGSQTGPADLLAQQAAIYSAMAAGIQPLMVSYKSQMSLGRAIVIYY